MASGPALGVSRTLLRRTRGCALRPCSSKTRALMVTEDAEQEKHSSNKAGFRDVGKRPSRPYQGPLCLGFSSPSRLGLYTEPLKSRNKPTLSLRTPRTRQRVINAPPSSAADPGRASFSMLVAIILRPKDDNLCGFHALMGAAVRLSNLDLDIWEQQHHREQQHRASRRAWDEGRVGEGWAE